MRRARKGAYRPRCGEGRAPCLSSSQGTPSYGFKMQPTLRRLQEAGGGQPWSGTHPTEPFQESCV